MKIRLGSIKYINSLPVDGGMLSGAVGVDAEIIQGAPAELNEKMLESKIDVSPVSAFFYGQNQKDLLLLPHLSISSQSAVRSVLLFSRYKPEELKDKTILITNEGRTTPALLEILLRQRWRFLPHLKKDENGKAFDKVLSGEASAALLIGDEALMAHERVNGNGLRVIDLAEEWQSWMAAPIVFAVWVVRREFFEKHPDKVRAVHSAILKSKEWGSSHLEEILKMAAGRIRLEREVLEDYFSKLSYDFDEEADRGMRLYFNSAIKCGLLSEVGIFENIYDRKKRKILTHVPS